MKTTGLDHRLDVGDTITRIYFAVPSTAGIGMEHATHLEALQAAIDDKDTAVARHHAFHNDGKSGMFVPLPQRIDVDLRWFVTKARGGGMDILATRFTYDDLADARRSADLLIRYAAPATI